MTCACIAEFNVQLERHNTRIVEALLRIDNQWTSRPTIVAEQIEGGRGKKKAATVVPTFCAFCGVRYELEPAVPATETAHG